MPHPPHINPVGDIIGAIGGIGLGYFGAQAAQKQQQENQTADMLSQAALKDPSILKDPEVQKLLTKRRGKDYVGFLTKIGQAQQATMASFPGGAGGAPQGSGSLNSSVNPPGTPPGVGTSAAYQAAGPFNQNPSVLNGGGTVFGGGVPAGGASSGGAAMIGAAGGTPTPGGAPMGGPAGAPPAGGAAPTAPGAAAPVDPVQKLMDENDALERWGVAHPDHKDLVDEHVKENQFKIEQLNKQKDVEETRADRASHNADTEADRALARESVAATREATRANAEATRSFNEEMKTKDYELTKAKDEDARAAKVAEFGKSIESGADKITEDFSKATTDDAKGAFKARADHYNSWALKFYSKNPDAGSPTILKFTPGVAGSGARGIGGFGKAGTSPTLDSVPTTPGTYKGKPGFMDPDGNFYPAS